DPLRARDGPRARRTPGRQLPEEVLRLVSRPRALPAAVQAGAGAARLDGRGRAAPAGGGARRGRGARAARGGAPAGRRGDTRAADLDLRRRLRHLCRVADLAAPVAEFLPALDLVAARELRR